MSNIKLYKGDCYNIVKNIPDNSVDLVYIDIPYLYVSGSAGKSELADRMSRKKAQLQGIEEEYEKAKAQGLSNAESLRIAKNTKAKDIQITDISSGIDYSIFDELCRVMKKINIYIWCSKLQIFDIMNYFIGQKGCFFDILCWCKTNPSPTMNSTFLPDIEYCLFFRESGVTFNSKYELCWKYYISTANKSDKAKFKHPTIKPLDIVTKHILLSSNENDIVLDCFMGSGTTGVVCKKENRDFIGIELNSKYFDIAKNRIDGAKIERRLF